MPPNQRWEEDDMEPSIVPTPWLPAEELRITRCALLGCGMMGQEHLSYMSGYTDLRIDYLCDPHEPSLERSRKILAEFALDSTKHAQEPVSFHDEADLLNVAANIDLLVIASPNYLHTGSLTKWAAFDHLTILVEKPVAVNEEQVLLLNKIQEDARANIWVAMEYRYIPAVSKLISLLPKIGDIKMITIRENRYPFLHKIQAWNRDPQKTGDTLVEKCCHFFDLFRLISGREVDLSKIRSLAQRGINYDDEIQDHDGLPIIDAAYVVLPFQQKEGEEAVRPSSMPVGCLELCMYAEGSRHQEEIIVTGTKGRLEAYMPENKVFFFERPDAMLWPDRSVPPPPLSIRSQVFDCSNVKEIHGIDDEIPTHGGYHYSSTAIEWYYLRKAIAFWKSTGHFQPQVSLQDGVRAVQMGLAATSSIVNNA